jgi:hypothetical protein
MAVSALRTGTHDKKTSCFPAKTPSGLEQLSVFAPLREERLSCDFTLETLSDDIRCGMAVDDGYLLFPPMS